jgi:GNAT superfamily N-acetyltransferase
MAAIAAPPEPESEQHARDLGALRMLWYERGHRRAGQALLVAAEKHLREQGAGDSVAFDDALRLPTYHLGHACLTDRWDHVRALLGMNGYSLRSGEVFFDWPDFEPLDPGPCPIDTDISVERSPGAGSHANLVLTAYVCGERIAQCTCCSGGEFSRDERAQKWVFTRELDVDDGFQGQRFGRHLLLRALVEARAEGYVHAAISTEWTNHRAILFYGNLGYRAVDWTATYHRGAANGPA